MSFDDEPSAPLHGECAAEIQRLEKRLEEVKAANWSITQKAAQTVRELEALRAHIDKRNLAVDEMKKKLEDLRRVAGEMWNYADHARFCSSFDRQPCNCGYEAIRDLYLAWAKQNTEGN